MRDDPGVNPPARSKFWGDDVMVTLLLCKQSFRIRVPVAPPNLEGWSNG